jgi:hypothetical protein
LIQLLTYKNFDLSVFVYARVGQMIRDGIRGNWSPDLRENSMVRDYWTPNNPTDEYPRVNPSLTRSGWAESTTLLYTDGSFVKIKDITLGYTLPANMISKVASSARFYITLKNYFAFGKYFSQGRYDPEERGSTSFPIPKMFTMGANLTF